MKIPLTILIFLILSKTLFAKQNWQSITTVESLYLNYPHLIEEMFLQINLDYSGLEKVKVAYQETDFISATKELLEYYKKSSFAPNSKKKIPRNEETKINQEVELILQNKFTIQNVMGELPWGVDGHRNWHYKGPKNDQEWAWLSNRHHQLKKVYDYYQNSGDPVCLEFIDSFFRDFILKSLPYPKKKSNDAIWRGLEVSYRSKIWTSIFFGLIDNSSFSDASKILILSSLLDHADYNYRYHAKGGNWITMELSALAAISVNFPQFKQSKNWLDYTVQKMSEGIKKQVYPDGVQKEMSSHYHTVALKNFEQFHKVYITGKGKKLAIFSETLEKMYHYLAETMRPNGFGVLNNDSDLDYNRNMILEASKRYKNNEWEYIASNGKSGSKTSRVPSSFFPWAGQMISRSDFSKNAHWSFFDIGPWGILHQHNDKLHLSISAYGKDFLVDSGRFAYKGDVAKMFRPFARSSHSHNTVIIDQKGQSEGPRQIYQPIGKEFYQISEKFDFSTSSFDQYKNLAGKATHHRSVLYIRGKFWIVVDRIITDRPREIEILWHWHPDIKITTDGSVSFTKQENGNLSITPISDHPIKLTLLKGIKEPKPQGWYSPEYNIYEPNTVSSYHANIMDNTTFVWLITPHVKIQRPYKVQNLKETSKSIRLEIFSKEDFIQTTVPYFTVNDLSVLEK